MKWKKYPEEKPSLPYTKCWTWPFWCLDGTKDVDTRYFINKEYFKGWERSYPPQRDPEYWMEIEKPLPPEGEEI